MVAMRAFVFFLLAPMLPCSASSSTLAQEQSSLVLEDGGVYNITALSTPFVPIITSSSTFSSSTPLPLGISTIRIDNGTTLSLFSNLFISPTTSSSSSSTSSSSAYYYHQSQQQQPTTSSLSTILTTSQSNLHLTGNNLTIIGSNYTINKSWVYGGNALTIMDGSGALILGGVDDSYDTNNNSGAGGGSSGVVNLIGGDGNRDYIGGIGGDALRVIGSGGELLDYSTTTTTEDEDDGDQDQDGNGDGDDNDEGGSTTGSATGGEGEGDEQDGGDTQEDEDDLDYYYYDDTYLTEDNNTYTNDDVYTANNVTDYSRRHRHQTTTRRRIIDNNDSSSKNTIIIDGANLIAGIGYTPGKAMHLEQSSHVTLRSGYLNGPVLIEGGSTLDVYGGIFLKDVDVKGVDSLIIFHGCFDIGLEDDEELLTTSNNSGSESESESESGRDNNNGAFIISGVFENSISGEDTKPIRVYAYDGGEVVVEKSDWCSTGNQFQVVDTSGSGAAAGDDYDYSLSGSIVNGTDDYYYDYGGGTSGVGGSSFQSNNDVPTYMPTYFGTYETSDATKLMKGIGNVVCILMLSMGLTLGYLL